MARNATRAPQPRQKPPKPPKRSSGAQSAHTSIGDRLHSWRLHHIASGADALKRLLGTPMASLMTVLVIAIALALPVGLSMLLDNVRSLTRDWDGNVHMSVFLDMELNESRQRQLASDWQKWPAIIRTEVITREQALAEYKQLSGFGDALDALPDNPLPPLVIVYPASSEPADLEALKKKLGGERGVDLVQLDVEWVQRLHGIISVGEHVISALALALAAAVLLVVVNTIRLAIENRREEIVVVKIVGGTDGFVRRPFLYTGFWYGLAGGITAVLLVQIALWWIAGPVDELTALYQSSYRLVGLDAEAIFTLPLFAGLLGLLGAWLAVARHLKDIEPQAF